MPRRSSTCHAFPQHPGTYSRIGRTWLSPPRSCQHAQQSVLRQRSQTPLDSGGVVQMTSKSWAMRHSVGHCPPRLVVSPTCKANSRLPNRKLATDFSKDSVADALNSGGSILQGTETVSARDTNSKAGCIRGSPIRRLRVTWRRSHEHRNCLRRKGPDATRSVHLLGHAPPPTDTAVGRRPRIQLRRIPRPPRLVWTRAPRCGQGFFVNAPGRQPPGEYTSAADPRMCRKLQQWSQWAASRKHQVEARVLSSSI
mmetsp:Transcript_43465/g.114621  ORF Transcript_43465/g.114621 Transcript_43465/m.114621 type:complete len:254 (-) Transcript_43465:1048-1809(-)